MKVIQVVPRISDESSGPSYSVPGLCRGLKDAGCDVSLYFAGEYPKRNFDYPVHVSPIMPFPTMRLGCSLGMRSALFDAACSADIIHNNSFWMFPNVYPYQVVRKLRRERGKKSPKLVNAPRGTLAGWSLKHHALQKKLFGIFAGQYAAMRATNLWHATCEKEYQEIRAAGFRQPVAIVPVGMDIPIVGVEKRGGCSEARKKLVFFGRIHEVKGLDRLVLAWGNVVARHPDWELVVAGPDCGGKAAVDQIIAERRISRVRFVGELRGDAKYEFLSSADLYVLPSHTENFGVTVAEALACGTPCIASTGTPWRGLVDNRAGWWVDNSVESLSRPLEEAMSLPVEELVEMGVRGRRWIEEEFSWQTVGRLMKKSYEWLLGRGPKPDCVRVD